MKKIVLCAFVAAGLGLTVFHFHTMWQTGSSSSEGELSDETHELLQQVETLSLEEFTSAADDLEATLEAERDDTTTPDLERNSIRVALDRVRELIKKEGTLHSTQVAIEKLIKALKDYPTSPRDTKADALAAIQRLIREATVPPGGTAQFASTPHSSVLDAWYGLPESIKESYVITVRMLQDLGKRTTQDRIPDVEHLKGLYGQGGHWVANANDYNIYFEKPTLKEWNRQPYLNPFTQVSAGIFRRAPMEPKESTLLPRDLKYAQIKPMLDNAQLIAQHRIRKLEKWQYETQTPTGVAIKTLVGEIIEEPNSPIPTTFYPIFDYIVFDDIQQPKERIKIRKSITEALDDYQAGTAAGEKLSPLRYIVGEDVIIDIAHKLSPYKTHLQHGILVRIPKAKVENHPNYTHAQLQLQAKGDDT